MGDLLHYSFTQLVSCVCLSILLVIEQYNNIQKRYRDESEIIGNYYSNMTPLETETNWSMTFL